MIYIDLFVNFVIQCNRKQLWEEKVLINNNNQKINKIISTALAATMATGSVFYLLEC